MTDIITGVLYEIEQLNPDIGSILTQNGDHIGQLGLPAGDDADG
ncbi:MAG: hypothetical protein AAF633_04115 [Chloroflexota bacterium]